MESYPEVRKSLNSFLANIVHDMAIERTHIKDAQTVQVEGTSYEEINANQSVRFDLKEYETEIQVHNDDIRTLDPFYLHSQHPLCKYQSYRKGTPHPSP